MRSWRNMLVAIAVMGAATATIVVAGSGPASALPPGFADNTVFYGLTNPTAVRFTDDGRVVVLERAGVVKLYDSLADPSPTTLIDISGQVETKWDRGALGLEVSPNFSANPYIYVLYSLNQPEPQGCPNSGNDGDCITSGRLSRWLITNNTAGPEQPLLTDWCMQFGSHSIGDLKFSADGASLFVSGGEGANFLNPDYGQFNGNPCGDPTYQGGALRSQDYQSAGDPQSLGGSIIRINPTTAAGVGTNPFAGSGDANRARIVAQGLRNPFRIATRPGTGEVWAGDVGWGSWEEINRVANPSQLTNFGWPCYEGSGQNGGYAFDNNLTLCQNLYANPTQVTAPAHAYAHTPNASSSTSGLAFYPGGAYPASYNGGLFFGDYSEKWIKFAPLNGGQPDFGNITTMVTGQEVVDLEAGPNGDIFYVNLVAGTVHRLSYTAGNNPPVASFTVSPGAGPLPLTVNLNASASTDPENDPMTFSWDLNGDGTYGDASGVTASTTFTTAGTKTIRLKVSDPSNAFGTTTRTVSAGNGAPVPVITAPASGSYASVGGPVLFSGYATDPEQGLLAASSMTWTVTLHHCTPTGQACHNHEIASYPGVTSGALPMPDHDYYSYLELTLTAIDATGTSASTTSRIEFETVPFTVTSNPPGVQIPVGSFTYTTPFTVNANRNSSVSIGAPSVATVGGSNYVFSSWSNGGAQNQTVVAGSPINLTVNYNRQIITGTARLDQWINSPGLDLYDIPLGNAPTSSSTVTEFRVTGLAANTGARVRALLVPPTTGNYRFWMASDDQGVLDLSTTDSPAQRRRIANVATYSPDQGYDVFPEQMSGLIPLNAGQPYFIEGWVKQGGGVGHLSVAWSGPGISRQVIPGSALAPDGSGCTGWCPDLDGSILRYQGLAATGLGEDPTRIKVIDTNADGYDDLVQFASDGGSYRWLGGATGFNYVGLWGTGHGADAAAIKMADVGGDDRPDVIQFAPDGSAYVWINTGSGFSYRGLWGTGFGGDTRWLIVDDLAGAGQAQVVQFTPAGESYLWTSDGARFVYAGRWGTGHGSDVTRIKAVRFTGGGPKDLVQFASNGSSYRWATNLSGPLDYRGRVGTGHGTDHTRLMIGDMNGDGADDVTQFASTGSSYRWLGTAGGFDYQGLVATGHGYDSRYLRLQRTIGTATCAGGTEQVIQYASNGNGYLWDGTRYFGRINTGFGSDPSWLLIGDVVGNNHDDTLQMTAAGNAYLWRNVEDTTSC